MTIKAGRFGGSGAARSAAREGRAERANAAARSAVMEGTVVAKWSGKVGQIGQMMGWLREARQRADEVADGLNDRQEDWLVPSIGIAIETDGIVMQGMWASKSNGQPHSMTEQWLLVWDELALHGLSFMLAGVDKVASELKPGVNDVG